MAGLLLSFVLLWVGVSAGYCDDVVRRRLRKRSTDPLAQALADGKLDYLAADDAPYSASEVGCIAANMAGNMFPNGTVVAAPSQVSSNRSNDYYFMWQRDAAMSMTTLLRLLVEAPNKLFEAAMSDPTSPIRSQLVNYALLTDPNTLCPPWYKETGGWCPGMGEPKYLVNGSVYPKIWGRPQNDGPAIAGVFLAELLNAMLDVGDAIPGRLELQRRLLHGQSGVLYQALDFTNTWYNEGSTEPWEEVYGRSFYVSEVQRQALFEGTIAAERMGMNQSAAWPKSAYPNWLYSAYNLKSVSLSFASEETQLVKAMSGRQKGLAGPKCINSEVLLLRGDVAKVWVDAEAPCELDAQTLIAANFVAGSLRSDPVLPPHEHRMLETSRQLFASMAPLYEVNAVDRAKGLKGMLIGRYPGDTYCGYGECGKNEYGNPWFVATHALAEQMYFVARAWCQDRLSLQAVRSLSDLMKQLNVAGMSALEVGDAIMKNAKEHVIMPGVHMSEQIQKSGPRTGQQAGVPDLTWSYSSALSALSARQKAIAACRS